MKTILEEKLKNWNKVIPSNKGRYPLWFLKCKCSKCVELRNRLGINCDSDLITEYKPSPGFKIDW